MNGAPPTAATSPTAPTTSLDLDYLRDNMKFDLKDYVQRPHHYAIVDEVDSILIDEARTPLIISGSSDEVTDKYFRVDKVIPHLIEKEDYEVDEKHRQATPTDSGIAKPRSCWVSRTFTTPPTLNTTTTSSRL